MLNGRHKRCLASDCLKPASFGFKGEREYCTNHKQRLHIYNMQDQIMRADQLTLHGTCIMTLIVSGKQSHYAGPMRWLSVCK